MNATPALLQAQQLLDAGRLAEARPLLERLLAAHPGERSLLYPLCEAEIVAGDAATALRRLEALAGSADPEAAFLHARALAALGRAAEARQAFGAPRLRLPPASPAPQLPPGAPQAAGRHTGAPPLTPSRAAAPHPPSPPPPPP